jgi:hypothetical protein
MKKMNVIALVFLLLLGACGKDAAAPVTEVVAVDKAEQVAGKPTPRFDGTVAKVGSPFSISYKIIGTPVVGSPVTIELRVTSALAPQQAEISFSIPDDSSMILHEAQPQSVAAEFAENEKWVDQRVTVVPMREGRIYLNVAASAETADGRIMTMMAVPIQVGQGGRELEEHGELSTDEDGEAIRVLTSD